MKKFKPCPDIPTILVVLGATGDLINKKVIPSVCHLHMHKRLPPRFRVIGMARRDIDLRANVREQLLKRLPEVDEKTVEEVSRLFDYHQGDFSSHQDFEKLHARLEQMDNEWGVCSNKLFYLAVPPAYFGPIFENMVKTHLNIPCGGKLGWTRLLIEKPFGQDLNSSKKLFAVLKKSFKDEQLYLIDHYLAKDIVQAIKYFRFSNNLFEHSWNRHAIERIDVVLHETNGAEERGAFYETVGAFRDVGQNHLLQMLAAITMEASNNMSAESERKRRTHIIETLKPWTPANLKADTFRAQYDGYREIKNVDPASMTETFFKLKTELMHPDWRGVAVTLESGKRCPLPRKEVVVTFKPPAECLGCSPERQHRNRVVFTIEPDDRISIHFWTAKPGFDREIEERTFDFFLYEHTKKVQYVEEYADLIYSCIVGKQNMFVSEKEILAQWKFTDPIIKAWGKDLVPLERYTPDSNEMIRLSARVGNGHTVKDMEREIGVIGLGKMGANMCRRLMDKGWRVVGYNRSPEAVQLLKKEGLVPVFTIPELVKNLSAKQKVIWLMVPAGKPVDEVLFGKEGLVKYLKAGDLIIDGGNSYYKDAVIRAKKLAKYGIRFLDCGTSGGPGGARNGACLMIGGKRKDFEEIETLFYDFALPKAYQFFEGAGAGHFVKMVHNGIEYGMMQAIAEGFAIMKRSSFKLDLTRVSDIYNHGSVIESRLVGWLKDAFVEYGEDLKAISGEVQHSGEGTWTVKTAKEMKLEVKIIEEALKFREYSIKDPSYTGQVVSALRGQFGGHPVLKKK